MRKIRGHDIHLFLTVLLFATLTGCAVTTPSLNSFQANINYKKKVPPQTETTQKVGGKKIIVLVHGIYGDAETFGDLADILLRDPNLNVEAVYIAEYWSSRIFPNFQRLADLGAEFEKHLDSIASNEPNAEVIVIAHSQGGLIARNAILAMKDKERTDILDRMKLIMIGTPNYASLFATYNNLVVNSVFAPVTYGLSLATLTLAPPLVYNRQAYDMANTRVDLIGGRDNLSPFMENMVLRWARAFPTGTNERPKVYAIVGVLNLLDQYDLSDGVVHSLSTLFVGVPAQRIHYVPYKHFGAEAAIEDDSHYTYRAIKVILKEGTDPVASNQRLSPIPNLSISTLMFVTPAKPGPVKVRVTSFSPSRKNQTEGSLVTMSKNMRANHGGLVELFSRYIIQLAIFPFQILQTFNEAPVLFWDHPRDPKPQWAMLKEPTTDVDGEFDITMRVSREVSRTEEGTSWFWGLGQGRTEYAEVNFSIANSVDATGAPCRIECPVNWEGEDRNAKEAASENSKLTIAPNSVSLIEVDTRKNEDKDMVIISTGSCIEH